MVSTRAEALEAGAVCAKIGVLSRPGTAREKRQRRENFIDSVLDTQGAETCGVSVPALRGRRIRRRIALLLGTVRHFRERRKCLAVCSGA